MLQRPIAFLTLTGIALGLLIGIIDSVLHYNNYEIYEMLNIITFLLFFTCIYWSIIFLRDEIGDSIISYGSAFINMIFTGFVSAFVIGFIRYIYLCYIIDIDIVTILGNAKNTMLNNSNTFTNEQIFNRLAFIEFSYNPLISSLLYFSYYLVIVIIFAIIASFFIKRIDRNISM